MTKAYKIRLLTKIALQINHLADSGHAITENVIRERIEDRTLFRHLQEKYRNPPSLANDFASLTEEQKGYLYDVLGNASNCYIKEDCCVENSGFCLLVAFLLMCIQTELDEKG